MNWLKQFFGTSDKAQKQQAKEVASYVDDKKIQFNKDMKKIHQQAKVVHRKTRQVYESSLELNKTVEDVAKKIAIATGGFKL